MNELQGSILRALNHHFQSALGLERITGAEREAVTAALDVLVKDGAVVKHRSENYSITSHGQVLLYGWNEATQPEVSTTVRTLKPIVNCWTIYHSDDEEVPSIAEFRRPQDWGDPRWMYRVYHLEALGFRNECHCWIDQALSDLEHLEAFAQLMTQIMQPGIKRELAGRDFVAEEDFWVAEWGSMPPEFIDPDEAEWVY